MSASEAPAITPSSIDFRGTDPLPRVLRDVFLIVVLSLTVNLTGNGRISLWDRDEPRYAGATREMRASGDLLKPTFNAEPRYHKPILIYWLMMAGTALGGDNPFGARLISSLAGTATCLVTWALGRRMFGARAGLLAGLILASAPIVFVESKLATTDAFLMLCLVSCQAALWELNLRPSRAMVGVFWVGLALAVLTKGPIGPALLVAAALAGWWWGAPRTCLSRLCWRWGLPIFALITLPWYIAIGVLSHGEFYEVAMGFHVIKRMTSPLETHGGFPGYYAVLSVPLFHPWSAFVPVGFLAAWTRRRSHPEMPFLLGWILGPLVLLELVRTKLIHYYLPAYPACALLVAWVIGAVADSEVNLRRWPLGRLSLGLLTGLGIGMAVAALAGVMVLPTWALRGPCLMLAILLAVGTMYAMERFQTGATLPASYALVVTWGLAGLVFCGMFLPAAQPFRLSPMIARHLAELERREHATALLAGYKPPSLVYDVGHPLPIYVGNPELVNQVQKHGTLVAALGPNEVRDIQNDPKFAIEIREQVTGLDVEHGKTVTLQLALIRPAGAVASRQGELSAGSETTRK